MSPITKSVKVTPKKATAVGKKGRKTKLIVKITNPDEKKKTEKDDDVDKSPAPSVVPTKPTKKPTKTAALKISSKEPIDKNVNPVTATGHYSCQIGIYIK